MTRDADVLEAALAWLRAGRGVALATVLRTWGSSPRPAGSLLAVNDGLELAGSVSGGCVEAEVVDAAQGVIRAGGVRRLAFGVPDGRAWEVGLACGGRVEIAVHLAEEAVLAEVLAAAALRSPRVVATELGGGASEVLDPLAASDHTLAVAAREAAARDASVLGEGVAGPVFLGVFNPPVRVIVVGAVHVAQALVPMVQLAGYEPVVVDPRTAFATPARFPFAGVRLVTSWPDAALAAEGLDARTAVVTLTHDPKLDDPALVAALGSSAFYVGALGSRKTHAARRDRLATEAGLDAAALDRIRAPVGLPIGAVSPGEVAGSILAELVAALRTKASGGHRSA
jgi:xanthine dehydrogenase accessory factor